MDAAGIAQMQAPAGPLLFTPLSIRGRTLRNRIVLPPLCQYSARDGHAGDWHLVHLGKFALGGMGLVFTEATAVEERGRISHGDLGIWSDDFVPGLRRLTDFIRGQGALAGIQLAHAGRKGGWQRPWEGNGPVSEADQARGEGPYALVGPTGEALRDGFTAPTALDAGQIAGIVASFAEGAARAHAAGFDVAEIHGGHGYLISSFLSPGVNTRADGYGGDRAGRMRLALEIARAVRERWPRDKPLFFRMSSVDGDPQGWSIEDSIALATELKGAGVDVVDCSSGGMRGATTYENAARLPGFQVPYAEAIRRGAGIATMAVGHILDGHQAESVLSDGRADLVAVGRQAMYDPYWAHHAALALGSDPRFEGWTPQAGWWLAIRAEGFSRNGLAPDGTPGRDAAGAAG
jgi:2,4-dienoyl-CoA reductase-like NADH-dependent reductase (Old Yellow Enzyme family)